MNIVYAVCRQSWFRDFFGTGLTYLNSFLVAEICAEAVHSDIHLFSHNTRWQNACDAV